MPRSNGGILPSARKGAFASFKVDGVKLRNRAVDTILPWLAPSAGSDSHRVTKADQTEWLAIRANPATSFSPLTLMG